MINGDNITDEQIRESGDERAAHILAEVERVAALAYERCWSDEQLVRRNMLLNASVPWLLDIAKEYARARCAEILNARKDGVK